MHAVDIITKKRDGSPLTSEEIEFFIRGYTHGSIPDYQAAAWCMAVYFQGMTEPETVALTLAMAHSGEVLDLHDIAPRIADKHSSGGVGDKTTLVIAPLVAACGVPVAKMSGRALGFSGGTLDKLESIPGFRADLSVDEFRKALADCGVVVSGQTANLAPADGKLYALRDVTGTVASVPLIASSIMSKKIAGGADAIVLDVKVGHGAFMETEAQAANLARTMTSIGRGVGRHVAAVISDMSQPLGQAVGNAVEVREAIETLRGGGPADFLEHCLVIAGCMIMLAGKSQSEQRAAQLLREKLASGAALAKFRDWIAAQGGDTAVIDNPDLLPKAPLIETVPSPQTGFVAAINARAFGYAVVSLGGGREKKGAPIDHRVGIVLGPKVGAWVEKGQPLFTIHAGDDSRLNPCDIARGLPLERTARGRASSGSRHHPGFRTNLNTLPPHTPHVPRMAWRPFSVTICSRPSTERCSRQRMQ